MSGGGSGGRASRPRSAPLALAAAPVWLLATASAGWLGVWAAVGGAAVVLGAAALLLARPAATSLLRPSPRLVLLGVGVGGAMAAATYLLYPPLSALVPFIGADTARLYAGIRLGSPLVASAAIIPVVVGEELVWRGAVQGALAQRLGPWAGVALTALLHALVHAPLGSPVLVAVAFSCGLVWGALRAATASLVPTLAAHLLWSALVLVWRPLGAG